MNVYWCGGEDIDLTLVGGGNITWQTVGPYINTSFCRIGYEVTAASTSWPMANAIFNTTSFGNRSSFWFHAQMYPTANATSASGILLALADNAGVGRLLVRGTGTAGQLKISTRNAAGTFVDLVTSAANAIPVTSALMPIDLFVNYSSSGQATLYINGVNVADTGSGVNVTTDSATSLSFAYMGGLSGAAYIWSEIVVADSDTRSTRLWTMNSNTAGNAQTWSGTASNVNQTRINDANFISAASAGLINEYKTGGIALPGGTYTVGAVAMTSRAMIGSAGPQHLEYVTRVGSTDYVGGTWSPLIGAFANDTQNYMQATNPATGIAWTTADLTATTFNYGVESVA